MRPWSSALLSLSIYPAVEKSPWNISRGPSIPKNLGPWENKQCLATAWLRALGDSEMSLAILARLICWETGLQTHRARPACLGTTEVWVLRGPHSAAVDLSTAPWQQAAPGLDPDQELRSHPSAPWNATPGLPCWPCPGPYIAIQVLSTSPVPQCPSLIFPRISILRDLCKAEAALAMSAKTLRWGRVGESIGANPQFSCQQVEGLRGLPRRLSSSLHSHSCPL